MVRYPDETINKLSHEPEVRLVVPVKLQGKLQQLVHGGITGGHAGSPARKTKYAVERIGLDGHVRWSCLSNPANHVLGTNGVRLQSRVIFIQW